MGSDAPVATDDAIRSDAYDVSGLDCGMANPPRFTFMSKCDLHVHSLCSARSEEGLIQRFAFTDSQSEPGWLHAQLLDRGMDYVTITDHDTIEGCLAIADLPQTFISEQVTTHFPHDPCKIHLLIWGISEAQHAEIVRLRE